MRRMLLSAAAPIESAPLVQDDVVTPVPGPGQLLIQVEACAVCRTDLQLAEGDIPPRAIPLTPGHQVVGTVVALGADAGDWSTDDRAAIGWLASTCGTCGFCTAGRENLCEAAAFTGWDRAGGFATHVVVDAAFAFPMPSSAPPAVLAPLLCGGVIGYRSLHIAGIQPGQRLGLYGFGASARLSLQVALRWGCDVYVATRSHSEQQRALEMGARWAGGYDDQPPEPLHAAVTFAPVGSVVVSALRAIAPAGTVAINAIHLDHIPEFNYNWLWRERSLRSVANYTRDDARAFLRMAIEQPFDVDIATYPLEQANEALAALKAGKIAGTGVLLPG
jgi:alcohol dehydrogenase, propanol-preferring